MKLTPTQELEAAIREHPANAELYLQIVPLYLESGRDYEAEKLLAKGAGETNDPRVIEQWEELTLARHARSVTAAEEWCATRDSPEARAALSAARSAQQRAEVTIYISRGQRNPADARAHFALGRRHQADGNFQDASAAYARAMSDAALRAVAARTCAECHEQLGQIPEALKHYRLAAASAADPQERALKSESLSRAGELASRLKMPKLATRYGREAEVARVGPV